MGNVLIALDDETEKALRCLAKHRHGDKKGALSQTATEAVQKLVKEDEWKKARDELLASMEKGYNFGIKGKVYKNRDEIYD